MKKKFFTALLAITVIAGMFPGVASADSADFYVGNTDYPIVEFDDAEYANAVLSFTAPMSGTANIIAAHYGSNDALLKTYLLDTVSITEGEPVSYTSEAISLEDTETLKLFAWDGFATLVPLMNTAGILKKDAGTLEKFSAKNGVTLHKGIPVTLGELFEAKNDVISSENISVTVTAGGDDDIAAFTPGEGNWTAGTLTVNYSGAVSITITDNNDCIPTTVQLDVISNEAFTPVFDHTDKFLYRIGNANTVALGKLFKAIEGKEPGTVEVTVNALDESVNASGTYTANTADWTKGTLDFNGTGPVEVVICDETSDKTTLKLEVVDAVNATSATSATANNVVLLNNCGFGSLEVSGGYTLYGNGFTMTCTSDSPALDMGYSFVTLNNGTLDNVQIVCPNFDYAALYKSNLTSDENRSQTTDKTRYYNARSGVMAYGNSKILNSRISGGRASLNASGGNIVVDNSRIELGAVASILVGSANSLVLRDTTLIQKPVTSTYDSSKTLMGFSVLYMCDSEGNATPTTIEGDFIQQAWIDESDSAYVPSGGEDIITTVLSKTEYLHDIDGDGTDESLNLGFAYMPDEISNSVAAPTNITDNRSNKTAIPYEMAEVPVFIATVYVYSYTNANGTADTFKTETEYIPDKYGDVVTVTYADTAEGLTVGKSYTESSWVYELNVDLDTLSGYALDFSKLSMNINGIATYDYKVNGNDKPTSPVAVTAGGTLYTLTTTVDGKEYTTLYKVTGTEASKESPSVVAAEYAAGLCVASSAGGTWSGAAPALEGIQIKYWSVAENQYKTIALSDYTPETPGKQNDTNTTWTYIPDNGDFTLTLTGGQVHSSNNVYAMPVVCDGKLYFVASNSKGLVNTGNSARNVPVSYVFKDNNGGTPLTFSHTWSVEENKDEQYKYSDFCNGTLTKLEGGSSGTNPCVTPDTLITLADGSHKEIQALTGSEELLVWNHTTGKYDTAPVAYIVNHNNEEKERLITHLFFDDGKNIEIIGDHVFFDITLNKYVTLNSSAADYIGHEFAVKADDGLKGARLIKAENEYKITRAYEVVAYQHITCFTDDILSASAYMDKLLNIFDIDTATFAYNPKKMAGDIERYGLYTYEDFKDIVSEEAFELYNAAYLKIAVGKGYITWDDILALVEVYDDLGIIPIS